MSLALNVICQSRELYPEEIVFYVNRRGTRRTVIFCLVLLLTFLLSYIYVSPNLGETDLPSATKVLVHIAGIGGIVLFGILGLMFLRRLYSRQPYLVISPRGVYDNASGSWSGAGWIDWSEIADVRLSKYQGLPCVELVPKNRERFLQRFNWLERLNRSARFGYPAVALRGPLLPVEPALLAEQIRGYWRNVLNT
ncbi:MAG: STM3941 family protein [Gammaproteobacteria bacterium]